MPVNHTPGPWEHGTTDDGVPYVQPGTRAEPTAWPWFCRADMEDAEGEDLMNGQLMAAAPDLLTALQEMVEMFDAVSEKANWAKSFLNSDTLRRMNEAPIAARQAIVKATGSEAV